MTEARRSRLYDEAGATPEMFCCVDGISMSGGSRKFMCMGGDGEMEALGAAFIRISWVVP